jgi:hypothetical protein
MRSSFGCARQPNIAHHTTHIRIANHLVRHGRHGRLGEEKISLLRLLSSDEPNLIPVCGLKALNTLLILRFQDFA